MAAAYPPDYDPHQSDSSKPSPPTGLLRWALANLHGYPLGRRSPAPVRAILGPAGRWVLAGRRAIKYLPMTGAGRLLDFGCGAGDMVAAMAAAGWKAEGVDASPQAVRTARARGLDGPRGHAAGPGAAGGLVRRDYAVALAGARAEPKATLEAVRRLLVPGGRVLVAVPRLDSLDVRWFGPCWWGLDVPRHLTHFTRAALRRHLEAAGLEVERVRAYRHPMIFRRSLALMAEDPGRWFHRTLSHSRFVVGLASLAALAAGKTGQMAAIARRPR